MPIALINLFLNYEKDDNIVFGFSIFFFLITTSSGLYFFRKIKTFYRNDNEKAVILNIKRKDVFVSGAISYYVLPFISFISSGRDGVYILCTLIVLFLIIFTNNRMFLYTPLFDILAYKILECDIKINDKLIHADIIVKDGNQLYFTGENSMRIYKIEEGIFAAERYNEIDE
jgi:hypothetical protein